MKRIVSGSSAVLIQLFQLFPDAPRHYGAWLEPGWVEVPDEDATIAADLLREHHGDETLFSVQDAR